jgi:hypothetical protein
MGPKDIANSLLNPNLLKFVEMEVIASKTQVSYHIAVPSHHKISLCLFLHLLVSSHE